MANSDGSQIALSDCDEICLMGQVHDVINRPLSTVPEAFRKQSPFTFLKSTHQSPLPKLWVPFSVEYFTYEKRLSSFLIWPKQMIQKKEDMAQAGFYYLGQSDIVYCFHCGISLHNWKPTDDPFVEHNKHSPKCPYLLMICTI